MMRLNLLFFFYLTHDIIKFMSMLSLNIASINFYKKGR